jgi:endonuclease YncB( thermonuclease family)
VSKVIKGDVVELSMTHMHRPTLIMIIFSLLLLTFLFSNVIAASISSDKTATVSTVIDGSSFIINSGETVKLAGMDTPQSGQQGYSEAKNYLKNMAMSKTVYLDIDKITPTDQYGRLMSVAYIDYNLTHYENVNMAMIVNNYAVPISVNNSEFNPSSWSWFVPKDTPSPIPTFTSTPTASPSVAPYSPPPTPTIDPGFLTSTPTVSPSVAPYSLPSTPILNLSVPEFLVLAILIIISIAIASVILLKLHKKKS